VATVHDMAVFDVPWALSRRKAFGERWLYRQALARADVVIAVSAFTAERVKAWLRRDAVVVHEGAPDDLAPAPAEEVAAVRARYELPEAFVVHVGTVEPRKDTPTLAAACRAAGLPLVLAGAVAPGQAVPAGARSLGYVPRSDLPGLYGAATAVGYPSRYEGFGLPPLEAMACGAPVVASAATALPEVLGDAAVLARPGDVDGWARALRDLADDGEHRAALVVAGGRRAAELTWKAAAEGTGAVYRSLGVPA
jgi:glycosyltransferase involved in cell wall biosynthesis